MPRTIFGRFAVLCAILRQIVLCFYLLLYKNCDFDAVFVDQLSFCVPLLKFGLDWRVPQSRASPKKRTKILFYCHFPDKLLAHRTSLLKRIYRIPFDAAESLSTSAADVLAVNSRFTQGVFRREFPSISRVPKVIYPCVADISDSGDENLYKIIISSGRRIALSINRFERKKGIELAVRAYASLQNSTPSALFIAGGYDVAVRENVEYLSELRRLCDEISLTHVTITDLDQHISRLFDTQDNSQKVIFLPSISTRARTALVRAARVLLYTPENEHFGIVPLESMLQRTPVLATTSGGPLETVADGKTGWLRSATTRDWSRVLAEVLFAISEQELEIMGERARTSVLERFTRERMAQDIELCFTEAIALSPMVNESSVPALLREVNKRDAAWLVFLGWAVYYCKFGFSLSVPKTHEIVLGVAIVLVVYYSLF